MFNYDLIIFDLDGTLINSEEGIVMSIENSFIDMGMEKPLKDDILKCIGPPLNYSFKKMNIPQDKISPTIERMKYYYDGGNYKKAFVYKDLIKVLEFLKNNNIKMAVATLKPTNMAKVVLKHFNLEKYFSYIIGPNDDNVLRSKSKLIKKTLDKLNISSKQALMVGDYPSDALGAKENNVDFLAIMFGFGFTKKNVENYKYLYKIENYRELLEILVKNTINL